MLDKVPSKRTVLSSEWGRFMYRPSRAAFVPSPLWQDLTPTEWLIRALEKNIYMQTATWLVSREVTEAAGPWNTQLLSDDDGEYFARVMLSADGIKFVPNAKVYYRVVGSSNLSYFGRSDKKMDAQWASMKLRIQYMRALDDGPRGRAACVEYLRDWMVCFYPLRIDLCDAVVKLAKELGGDVSTTPIFSWKHNLLKSVVGWHRAQQIHSGFGEMRSSLQCRWDRAQYRKEQPKLSATSAGQN